jgi:hypothetical protein
MLDRRNATHSGPQPFPKAAGKFTRITDSTFDMSGAPKHAKRPLERPLDEGLGLIAGATRRAR